MNKAKPKILYLVHDLSDPSVFKRVSMLRDGGADVTIAGFRRTAEPLQTVADCPVVNFGQTYDANFKQRLFSVTREWLFLRRHRSLFLNADIIIARTLEMLTLAVKGQYFCAKVPKIFYESLDIHRLLLRNGAIGKFLRFFEERLTQKVSAVLTSSPAFISEYFLKRSKIRCPIYLIENKIYASGYGDFSQDWPKRPSGPPWRIGWFGAIRCKKSLRLLTHLVRQSNGTVEVEIRGRPSLDQFADFHEITAELPGLKFLGRYKNPDDLEAIYQGVHFTWAIDQFEEGLNSSWLLPNRLYEGGIFSSVPIAQKSVETGHFLEKLGIGVSLSEPLPETVALFFQNLTSEKYRLLEQASYNIPIKTWCFDREDCKKFVDFLLHPTVN